MSQIELAPQNLCDPTRVVHGARFTCAGKADNKTTFPCTGAMHAHAGGTSSLVKCWCACHGGLPPAQPTKPALSVDELRALLTETEAALDLAIEERDELLRERKLLVEVATRALQLQERLDSWTIPARTGGARRDLRDALEAWTSDEASQREEDENG